MHDIFIHAFLWNTFYTLSVAMLGMLPLADWNLIDVQLKINQERLNSFPKLSAETQLFSEYRL